MPLPEKALIDEIRHMVQPRGLAGMTARPVGNVVLTGIGNDCAVLRLRSGQDSLVTTDLSLEGIHFRRDWHSPESVGHRCLARGLSGPILR